MIRRFQTHWRLYSIALALGAAMLLGHAVFGTPPGSSFKHNMPWFEGFREAFWQGVLYPRILPDLWFGMAGFYFYFNGPSTFWIAAVLSPVVCPGCCTNSAFSVIGALMLLASGGTFYLFARTFFERLPAGIGAIAFVLLPYHYLSDWFARQAIGEFSAYIFLPLLALATVRLIEARKGGALFARSFAAISLSHLPSALILVHVIAVMVVWAAFTRDSEWKQRGIMLARFALWGGLGAALSAFYWWPALSLLPLVSSDNLYSSYFEATQWLFLDGQPEPSETTAMTSKWQLALVLAAAGTSCFVLKRAQNLAAVRDWMFIPSLIAVFMMTVVSYPIWHYWILNLVQFPSRFFVVTDVSIALSVALIVNHIARVGLPNLSPTLRRGVLAIAATGLIASVAAGHQAQRTGVKTYSVERLLDHTGPVDYIPAPLFAANIQRFNQSVTDATPDAKRYELFFVEMERGQKLAMAKLQAVALETQIQPVAGRGFDLTMTLAAPMTVSLPIAPWPYWDARSSEGEPIPFGTDAELGVLTIDLPAGRTDVRLRAIASPAERASKLLSLAALLILVVFQSVYVMRFRTFRPSISTDPQT